MQSSKGCVRLRDALKCIGMHLGGYHYRYLCLTVQSTEDMVRVPIKVDQRSNSRR